MDEYVTSSPKQPSTNGSSSNNGGLIALGVIAGLSIVVIIILAIVMATQNSYANVSRTYKKEIIDINVIETPDSKTPGQSALTTSATGTTGMGANSGKRASTIVSSAQNQQHASAMANMYYPAQTLAEVGTRLSNNTYDQQRMERVRALEMASRQAAGQTHAMSSSVHLSPAAAALATADPSVSDQTGTLPPMIVNLPGTQNAYGEMSTIRTHPIGTSFGETDLRALDPETADEVDKALSLTAVPLTWNMDEKAQADYKNRELMKQMLLQGAVDPSVEDIMALSAPYVGTAEMVRRSLAAQRSLERSVINQPPMRFLYQSLTPRLPVPKPALSPFVAEFNQITPGLEYIMTETDCANSNAPVIQEPY